MFSLINYVGLKRNEPWLQHATSLAKPIASGERNIGERSAWLSKSGVSHRCDCCGFKFLFTLASPQLVRRKSLATISEWSCFFPGLLRSWRWPASYKWNTLRPKPQMRLINKEERKFLKWWEKYKIYLVQKGLQLGMSRKCIYYYWGQVPSMYDQLAWGAIIVITRTAFKYTQA